MSKNVVVIACLLVLSVASYVRGASSSESAVDYPSAWGATPAQFSGVGANGLIVDPYVLRQEVNSGGCLVAFAPLAEVVKRCGDDDGCTLRLVSDTATSREAVAIRSFVTAADGLAWTVATGFSTTASGLNGSNPVTEIVRTSATDCIVWDDFQNTGTDYELRACNNVSCTLRIDD